MLLKDVNHRWKGMERNKHRGMNVSGEYNRYSVLVALGSRCNLEREERWEMWGVYIPQDAAR